MPFYKVEQKGVPGIRLVEAPRADSALKHVVEDAFEVTQVDGRALLDAAKAVNNNIEIAGAPREAPEPAGNQPDSNEGDVNEERIVQSEGDDLNDPVRENPEDEDDRPLHEKLASEMNEQDGETVEE